MNEYFVGLFEVSPKLDLEVLVKIFYMVMPRLG